LENSDSPIVLEAGREWKIGRAPSCEVTVDNKTVSRIHARIFDDGDGGFFEGYRRLRHTWLWTYPSDVSTTTCSVSGIANRTLA